MGMQLFTLTWRGSKIDYQRNPLFDPFIQPPKLYSDLQLALLTEEHLACLEVSNLELVTTGERERIIQKAGKALMYISKTKDDPWKSEIRMNYIQTPLSIEIKNK